MLKGKKRISEGDIFILPLKNEQYAIGLVARCVKNAILAYYFNKSLKKESEFDSLVINKQSTILIQIVSTLGFSDGNWKIIGKLENFNKDDWEIPDFQQFSTLLKTYYRVCYDANLEEVERMKISEHEAAKLYRDGLAGYSYAENVISKLFTQ